MEKTLNQRLETFNLPLIEIKKYHLIGAPLDLAIPGTFGGITYLLSKIKKLNTVIYQYYKNEKTTKEELTKWKV